MKGEAADARPERPHRDRDCGASRSPCDSVTVWIAPPSRGPGRLPSASPYSLISSPVSRQFQFQFLAVTFMPNSRSVVPLTLDSRARE